MAKRLPGQARSATEDLAALTKGYFWRSTRGKFWAFSLGLLSVGVVNMVMPHKKGQSAWDGDLHV